MIEKVLVPDVGEADNVEVVELLVNVGDVVAEGLQPLGEAFEGGNAVVQGWYHVGASVAAIVCLQLVSAPVARVR